MGLRDEIESTISTLEKGEGDSTNNESSGSSGSEGNPNTEGVDTPTEGSGKPEDEGVDTPTEGSEKPEGEGTGTPTEGSGKPEGEAAGGKPTIPQAPKPDDRAPGTWSPEAREHWKTVPQAVKEQVWKREREATRALTLSTDARRFQDEFSQAVQPYLGFIAAEQSTPIQAVKNLMQSGAILRVGTKEQKVALVADVITRYGVDLEALDAMLGGQRQQQTSTETLLRQMLQQELAPFQQFLGGQRQAAMAAEQALDAEVDSDLRAFASDPKNEFFNDVKDLMADLMETAGRRGVKMDLRTAYERATLMHEPVRRVIEARSKTNTAQESQRIADAARRTAASVPNSADVAGASRAPADDVRSLLEANLRQASSGG